MTFFVEEVLAVDKSTVGIHWHHNPKASHHGEHAGAAVANEGKRESDDGEKATDHADIHKDGEKEGKTEASSWEAGKGGLGMVAKV